MRTLPAKLPNGRPYTPHAFFADGGLLVTSESSFEKADAIWRIDPAKWEAKEIANIAESQKRPAVSEDRTYASGFTVGGGRVVWWVSDGSFIEIWSAPVQGREARMITKMAVPKVKGMLEPPGIRGLSVVGEKLVWSVADLGGVYQVPLSGGEPERIEGTTGYQVVSWPWIGSPDDHGFTTGERAKVLYHTLRNVETGETRKATLKGEGWRCYLSLCGNDQGEIRRRDGKLVGDIARDDEITDGAVAHDRFAAVWREGAENVLIDIKTGKAGDLRMRPDEQLFIDDPARRLLSYNRGSEIVVIDVAAID